MLKADLIDGVKLSRGGGHDECGQHEQEGSAVSSTHALLLSVPQFDPAASQAVQKRELRIVCCRPEEVLRIGYFTRVSKVLSTVRCRSGGAPYTARTIFPERSNTNMVGTATRSPNARAVAASAIAHRISGVREVASERT